MWVIELTSLFFSTTDELGATKQAFSVLLSENKLIRTNNITSAVFLFAFGLLLANS